MRRKIEVRPGKEILKRSSYGNRNGGVRTGQDRTGWSLRHFFNFMSIFDFLNMPNLSDARVVTRKVGNILFYIYVSFKTES